MRPLLLAMMIATHTEQERNSAEQVSVSQEQKDRLSGKKRKRPINIDDDGKPAVVQHS